MLTSTSTPRTRWLSPDSCNRTARGVQYQGHPCPWHRGRAPPELAEDMGALPSRINERIVIVPQGEIEDERRVHHLILAEDFHNSASCRDLMEGKCKSFAWVAGPTSTAAVRRSRTRAHEVGGIIGPAHAFTPWTAMYAYFDQYSGLLWEMRTYRLSGARPFSGQPDGAAIADRILMSLSSPTPDAHSPLSG